MELQEHAELGHKQGSNDGAPRPEASTAHQAPRICREEGRATQREERPEGREGKEVKERPILFSGKMVRALLAGTKTQTRRIVKPQPISNRPNGPLGWEIHCPYGQPGDRLWVREGFTPLPPMQAPTQNPSRWEILYAAGGAEEREAPAGYNPMLYNYERWSPSIHMPRWASRLTLEITGVRVERLQSISEADAIAEGVTAVSSGGVTLFTTTGANCFQTAKDAYAALWESINGPGSWDANPWVWAIEFRRGDAVDGMRQRIASLEAEKAEMERQEPELAKALSVIVDYLGSTAECGYDPFAAEPLIESARAALAKAGVK